MTGPSPTAFVTGGTGFVGSHLVEALLASGYGEVRCLVRSDTKWLAGTKATIVHGTLADREVLERAVEGVDYVFHVAGMTRSAELGPLIESNVNGTLVLMESVERANPRVSKVLVTSSLAAVGSASARVADESTPLNPISGYGESKARMEAALRRDRWFERLPTVVVRPPAVYGPRDTDILTFFKSVNRGLCPVVGRGTSPEISLVHVSDLVGGMILAAESRRADGELYNLGSEEFYSWHAIRDAAAAAVSRRIVTLHLPRAAVPVVGAMAESIGRIVKAYPALNREKAREILDAVKMCSVEKAMTELGYRQKIDLQSGVASTIEWYRGQGLIAG